MMPFLPDQENQDDSCKQACGPKACPKACTKDKLAQAFADDGPVKIIEESRQPPDHNFVVAPSFVQLPKEILIVVFSKGWQDLYKEIPQHFA
jgi:hypothetical protein